MSLINNATNIYFNGNQVNKIYLNDNVVWDPTPPPSPTPSVTPSVSTSPTPSVTPSISISVTPSVTPSISTSPTPSLTPSISISASPGSYTWSGGKSYTYRPWAGGAYGQDGYITVDSGLVDHTATTFTARHVLGADQAQSDEAEYLSHVVVELY